MTCKDTVESISYIFAPFTDAVPGIWICTYRYQGSTGKWTFVVKRLYLGEGSYVAHLSCSEEVLASCLYARPTGIWQTHLVSGRQCLLCLDTGQYGLSPWHPTITELSETFKLMLRIDYEVKRNTEFLGIGKELCLVGSKLSRRVVKTSFCNFIQKHFPVCRSIYCFTMSLRVKDGVGKSGLGGSLTSADSRFQCLVFMGEFPYLHLSTINCSVGESRRMEQGPGSTCIRFHMILMSSLMTLLQA